jgi:hypothetical protein
MLCYLPHGTRHIERLWFIGDLVKPRSDSHFNPSQVWLKNHKWVVKPPMPSSFLWDLSHQSIWNNPVCKGLLFSHGIYPMPQ